MNKKLPSINIIERPRIVDSLEHVSTLPGGHFDDEVRYDALELTGAQLRSQRAARVVVVASRLRSVTLADSVLPGFELTDVRLDECDLANASMEGASFERVEIAGCRLVGMKAPESRLREVVFSDTNASFAQFRYASFKRVRFERCDLRNAEFIGSDLRGVVFDECDMRNALLASTQLDQANFCTSQIGGMQVGLESLRGAIVEPLQASQLAALMGLQIRWDDAEE